MGLMEYAEEQFSEPMVTPLDPNEQVVSCRIGNRRIGLQFPSVNVFLTNQRLITEVNRAALDFVGSSANTGGLMSGGGFAYSAGEWADKRIAKQIGNNKLIISLKDIAGMKPVRYKMFGIIPTPNLGLAITDIHNKKINIYFGWGDFRDKWMQGIQQYQANAPASTGGGWIEQK